MVSIVATAMAQENELLPDSPEDDAPACVLIFNASDPSGAGGLSGDALAVASVGAHALPVVTGAYMRDTAEIFDHAAFDEEAVAEQARSVLEDISVQVIKVAFCGSPENLSAIAEASSDYADVPVVAYMPNLSWWNEDQIDAYLDAFKELVLPQTTVMVGHHNTLWRWLLPDWGSERAPNARDLARAASQMGTPYVLVTGIQGSDAFVENVLATPNSVLLTERFERIDAVFTGAGDTLSAALAGLLAGGTDLETATREALSYLDRCLDSGFRPGMGHVVADRLFWAHADDAGAMDDGSDEDPGQATADDFSLPPPGTRH